MLAFPRLAPRTSIGPETVDESVQLTSTALGEASQRLIADTVSPRGSPEGSAGDSASSTKFSDTHSSISGACARAVAAARMASRDDSDVSTRKMSPNGGVTVTWCHNGGTARAVISVRSADPSATPHPGDVSTANSPAIVALRTALAISGSPTGAAFAPASRTTAEAAAALLMDSRGALSRLRRARA